MRGGVKQLLPPRPGRVSINVHPLHLLPRLHLEGTESSLKSRHLRLPIGPLR